VQYIFLFKNPRDNSQFAHLAKQLYPQNGRFATNHSSTRRNNSTAICCSTTEAKGRRFAAENEHFFGERQIVYVLKRSERRRT